MIRLENLFAERVKLAGSPLPQHYDKKVSSYRMDILSSNSPLFNGYPASAFPTEKICIKCGKKRPVEAFDILDVRKLDSLAGYSARCLNCLFKENTEPKPQPKPAIEPIDEYDAIWKKLDRDRKRYRSSGVTPDQYDAMFAKQNGVCAVCGCKETTIVHGHVRQLASDHDHVTGKFRGLLCGNCNRALGLLKDDLKRIRALAEYMEKHVG